MFRLDITNGTKAYVIGGACRDFLMGKSPKDFDIVTNATPETVCKIFDNSTTCGNSFLVSLVDGIEVATYRKDRTDHADVAHTLKEDVLRRDFTINAVAYDSDADIFIDYVDGKKDIKNRILRFIGEPQRRIDEDPVRILRGLRFAAKYNLTIESEAYFAIYANRDLLRDIPAERIQQEVFKAFQTNNTHRFLTLLEELQMFEYVFPNLIMLRDADFIRENDLVLSLEQLSSGEYALYLVKNGDEEENEMLELAEGRTCEDSISSLVNRYHAFVA